MAELTPVQRDAYWKKTSRLMWTIMILWFFFSFVVVSAWILLGIWFMYQILVPQNGVANWAHAGGFLAGMLSVLLAGGRQSILKSAKIEPDSGVQA